jgi:hypothetical protein
MTDSERAMPEAGPGAKMMFLIRRRAGASREELIAHWFANHMPGVIAAQEKAATGGHPHAWRYIATLFDPQDRADAWDGVAQLWFDQPMPRPGAPFGEPPRDSFQEKAEPYVPWATREYVIVDGSDRLPVKPLTLNAPFPTTRSGFCKAVTLAAARPGADLDAMRDHWLTVHAANVAATLEAVGGFRYAVSLSIDPATEPFVGMAELYFPDTDAMRAFWNRFEADGMEQWLDPTSTRMFTAGTEMIGIP